MVLESKPILSSHVSSSLDISSSLLVKQQTGQEQGWGCARADPGMQGRDGASPGGTAGKQSWPEPGSRAPGVGWAGALPAIPRPWGCCSCFPDSPRIVGADGSLALSLCKCKWRFKLLRLFFGLVTYSASKTVLWYLGCRFLWEHYFGQGRVYSLFLPWSLFHSVAALFLRQRGFCLFQALKKLHSSGPCRETEEIHWVLWSFLVN